MTLALAAAAAVALVAYALRLLTSGGAVAAVMVGSAAMMAGASWVALLLFFFISSSALSRWRDADRTRLTGSMVEKSARRDAVQVLANGGVFAVAALFSMTGNAEAWQAVGAGAMAAAVADTWSTEIGTVLGGTPRLILGGRPVPPGTSGGVTFAGSLTAVTAAVLASLVSRGVGQETPIHAVALGGMAGTLADSLLGAAVQERRWCDACRVRTERRVHSCGTPTGHRGGIRGCNNDIVNLLSTVAGAAATWILT
jgi:uncharacterized protein (TIGR00297 family)